MNRRDRVEELQAALGETRYLIGRELEAPAGTALFVARDFYHEDLVVIKVLPDTRRRRRRLTTAVAYRHRHLLPIYDWGRIGGSLFWSSPLASDGPVAAYATAKPGFGILQAVRVVESVLQTLDALHTGGVTHGRVKPSNVLVHRGRVVLADGRFNPVGPGGVLRDVQATKRLLLRLLGSVAPTFVTPSPDYVAQLLALVRGFPLDDHMPVRNLTNVLDGVRETLDRQTTVFPPVPVLTQGGWLAGSSAPAA